MKTLGNSSDGSVTGSCHTQLLAYARSSSLLCGHWEREPADGISLFLILSPQHLFNKKVYNTRNIFSSLKTCIGKQSHTAKTKKLPGMNPEWKGKRKITSKTVRGDSTQRRGFYTIICYSCASHSVPQSSFFLPEVPSFSAFNKKDKGPALLSSSLSFLCHL